MKHNKKGFTVVELVIVIAIIAILAAVLIPTFANIIKKANVSKDEQLIRNLNTALVSDRAEIGGKNHRNMTEALEAAEKFGYEVDKINASATNNEILWDQVNDVFCYLNGENVEYIPESVEQGAKLTKDDYRLWKIYNAKSGAVPAQANQTYSIYLGEDADISSALVANVLKVKVGVDVGKRNDITSIEYSYTPSGSESAHTDVVIRTNGGTLTIDAENDTVKHFGAAEVVTLTAVGTNSYHENGPVKQINIKKGRLIITNNKDTSIGTIYLLATGDTYDNIILATQKGAELPKLIARDKVSLPTGSDTKLVVTIQTNVDENGKQPEKTEKINLYSTKGDTGNDVYEATNGYNVSDLALLVVEASSATAKAQAAEQITDQKIIAQINESKVPVEVHNEDELSDALNAKAKYIIVKNDFSVAKFIPAKSNVTIEGGSFTITSSADRFLRIQDNNIELTIRNLTLDSNNVCQRGIQVDSNFKGYKITLDNVNIINNTYYAINMCGNTSGTFVATNCNISGWSALNTWGSGHSITFTNCTLTGTNNKSVSSSNTFAVLCLEADTTLKTNDYSSFNTVTLNGCTLNAVETNANIQNIVNFNGGNPGSTGNTLITNGCTFNSTNKHAYHDGGAGNSWINNGEEMLANVVADLSNITISEDGYNATGTVKFTINGKQISYNLSNATKSTWTSNGTTGMDYVFEYNAGILTYSLDLDLWSGYPNGYAVYVSSEFSK